MKSAQEIVLFIVGNWGNAVGPGLDGMAKMIEEYASQSNEGCRWVRVESQKDLPKEDGRYFARDENGHRFILLIKSGHEIQPRSVYEWLDESGVQSSGEGMREATIYDDDSEPIHLWFELSYAQYLTVPRSIMQAMPVEWQRKMAKLLSEMDFTYHWRPKEGRYWVKLKDGKGRYITDPLMQYRRPDFEYIESIKIANVSGEGQQDKKSGGES